MNTAEDKIKNYISENQIVLFMKGSKDTPSCGYSAKVARILDSFGLEYLSVDVMEDPAMRIAIKKYSDWPTLPQLYVDEGFIGGCDIVSEMYANGELTQLFKDHNIIKEI